MFPIIDILRFIEFLSLILSIWFYFILNVTSLHTPYFIAAFQLKFKSALQFKAYILFFNASFTPNYYETSLPSDETSNKLKPPIQFGLSFSTNPTSFHSF